MSEFIPNGCLSVLQARDLVGKQMYGAEWLGIAEYQPLSHAAEPDKAKATKIYAPAKAAGVKLMAFCMAPRQTFAMPLGQTCGFLRGYFFHFHIIAGVAISGPISL